MFFESNWAEIMIWSSRCCDHRFESFCPSEAINCNSIFISNRLIIISERLVYYLANRLTIEVKSLPSLVKLSALLHGLKSNTRGLTQSLALKRHLIHWQRWYEPTIVPHVLPYEPKSACCIFCIAELILRKLEPCYRSVRALT